MVMLKTFVAAAAVLALTGCSQADSHIDTFAETRAYVEGCHAQPEPCRGDLIHEGADDGQGYAPSSVFDPDAMSDDDWRAFREYLPPEVTRLEEGPEAYHAAAMRLYRS